MNMRSAQWECGVSREGQGKLPRPGLSLALKCVWELLGRDGGGREFKTEHSLEVGNYRISGELPLHLGRVRRGPERALYTYLKVEPAPEGDRWPVETFGS